MENKEPVIVSTTLEAGTEKIWAAITDPQQMKQWYFDLPGFKPEPGYEFSFEGGKDDRVYVHRCIVVQVVPLEKLCYTWRYDSYIGESLVCFELSAEGNTTTLVLTHSGLESFPADNPDLKMENFEKGWQEIIGTSLKNFLEKN